MVFVTYLLIMSHRFNFCAHVRDRNYHGDISNYSTTISQARMESESIAHEAKGRMGY